MASALRPPTNRRVWESIANAIGWGRYDKVMNLLPTLADGDINAADPLRGHMRYFLWAAEDSRSNTLLHYSAYWCKRDARIVVALLAAGADPSVLNAVGERPVELAAPAAMLVLDSAWNAVPRPRPTPPPQLADGRPHEWPKKPFDELPSVALKMLRAVLLCDIESIQRLLQVQTAVDYLNFGDRETLSYRLLPKVVRSPVDSRKAATKGNTYLHASALMATSIDSPAVACFKVLLAAGADATAVNAEGKLPFEMASAQEAQDALLKITIQALRDRGLESSEISALLGSRRGGHGHGGHGDVIGLLAAIGGGLAAAARVL